jgi:hypothetical protein
MLAGFAGVGFAGYRLFRNRKLRLSSYGNPSAVPFYVWEAMSYRKARGGEAFAA